MTTTTTGAVLHSHARPRKPGQHETEAAGKRGRDVAPVAPLQAASPRGRVCFLVVRGADEEPRPPRSRYADTFASRLICETWQRLWRDITGALGRHGPAAGFYGCSPSDHLTFLCYTRQRQWDPDWLGLRGGNVSCSRSGHLLPGGTASSRKTLSQDRCSQDGGHWHLRVRACEQCPGGRRTEF